MKYREETTILGNVFIVRTNEDETESWIPIDPANSDYQAYLNKDKPVEHFTPMVTDEADTL